MSYFHFKLFQTEFNSYHIYNILHKFQTDSFSSFVKRTLLACFQTWYVYIWETISQKPYFVAQ